MVDNQFSDLGWLALFDHAFDHFGFISIDSDHALDSSRNVGGPSY